MDLKLQWDELTADLSKDVRDGWWTTIDKKYSDEKRQYHNLSHLQEKFRHFNQCKSSLANPKAAAFAIFFHYLEYDPKSGDNEEKSIEQFGAFSDAASISEDSPLRQEVCDLIQQAATHSTEEHKTEGSYGAQDKHYFLDVDMAVLGSSPSQYDSYSDKIRAEYSFLPDGMYKGLRIKVLQSFLLIPNIFATKEFREKYEKQARENISKEIQKLQ